MASRSFWLLPWLSLLFTSITSAEVHFHDFVVKATPVKRLCKWHKTITVNGQLPGPTLEVRNGDSLVVNVVNRAKYNVTIHWHGVRQMRTAWADGPEYITQCPIKPGGNYTYRFTISGQEGTLWWHAHSSWLRATVYGALIIYPKNGSQYPFPMPTRDALLLLGEWWNKDPIEVVTEASKTGGFPEISDAYTINGQPGDLCQCSSNGTTVFPVAAGETNLFRIINAAVNAKLFVSIGGHNMTVVGVDSSYTKPFTTSAMMLGPGQTTNVLVRADQPPGRYYIAAWAYASPVGFIYDKATTTAILSYEPGPGPGPGPPQLPILLPHNDTAAVTAFDAAIKSSTAVELPEPVDENLFFTVGMGYFRCPPETACMGPNNTRFTASMNNFSFLPPSTCSILEAHQLGLPGVFTPDFPPYPPLVFNYTEEYVSLDLIQPVQATRVYPLKYGKVVQLVLQDTTIVVGENHPMHLHGYDFYVLAAGFGNFDAARDAAKFNLVDPPRRNTVGVPVRGWAVIRFVADNPGVWFMHCHLDLHTTWGLSMAFLVENGDGEAQSLEPRPPDLPPCSTDEPGVSYRGGRNNNRKSSS